MHSSNSVISCLRRSTSILVLLLVSGCGLFGLNGDETFTRPDECVAGVPVAPRLTVGVPETGYEYGDWTDTHACFSLGEGAGDTTYTFIPPQSGMYRFRLATDFDAVLYLRQQPCLDSATSTDCTDDDGAYGEEVVETYLEGGVPVLVVVDKWSGSGNGSYSLRAEFLDETPPAGTCDTVEGTISLLWDGTGYSGYVSGAIVNVPDTHSGACGGVGVGDHRYAVSVPSAGVYRLALDSAFTGDVLTLYNAACEEIRCGLWEAGLSAQFEVELDVGAYYVVVDSQGDYNLDIWEPTDLSQSCRQDCVTDADCNLGSNAESCLDTTSGMICISQGCVGCFANSQTCVSFPYTCEFVGCK